ncbi:MAG: hypothetical protein G01um101438_671 [Parcubacteria group bacterium Gr01-1014_38]|nr:MAG: hypothetical protein G01um101438_671 [Parcubacteria group bacterium Gr01-1014_38]
MILITGGSGILGTAITEAAQREQYHTLAPTHAKFNIERRLP